MSALNAPLDEQIFIALQAYEQIKFQTLRMHAPSKAQTNSAGRLSFNDIVNCVKAPNTPLAIAALHTINQSVDYRRKYRFVLMQMSMLQSPKQIAASSSTHLLERREEQFVLTIVEQKNKDILVQLSLQQSNKMAQASAFLHCESDERIEVLALQSDTSDRFVLAVSKDDTRLSALTNFNTHIYVTF